MFDAAKVTLRLLTLFYLRQEVMFMSQFGCRSVFLLFVCLFVCMFVWLFGCFRFRLSAGRIFQNVIEIFSCERIGHTPKTNMK